MGVVHPADRTCDPVPSEMPAPDSPGQFRREATFSHEDLTLNSRAAPEPPRGRLIFYQLPAPVLIHLTSSEGFFVVTPSDTSCCRYQHHGRDPPARHTGISPRLPRSGDRTLSGHVHHQNPAQPARGPLPASAPLPGDSMGFPPWNKFQSILLLNLVIGSAQPGRALLSQPG